MLQQIFTLLSSLKSKEELVKIFDRNEFIDSEPMIFPKYDIEQKSEMDDFRNYSILYTKENLFA